MTIVCDNTSNIDTMLNIIQFNLEKKNITFEPKDQWVRCLVHIIDLVVKKTLENLQASTSANEIDIIEETEETEEDLKSIVYKVSL